MKSAGTQGKNDGSKGFAKKGRKILAEEAEEEEDEESKSSEGWEDVEGDDALEAQTKCVCFSLALACYGCLAVVFKQQIAVP